MYNFLAKRGQLLAFLLGLVVVAIFGLSVSSGLDGFNQLSKEDKITSDIFNPGISAARLMVIVCVILFAITVIMGLITNPKGSLRMIIAFVAVAILIGIFYSMAPVDYSYAGLNNAIDKYNLSDNTVKLISGGIVASAVLTIGAFGIFIIMELVNIFK